MAGRMMSSNRNRSDRHVDNPTFDDGFYQHYRFKGKRRTGNPTGGRGVRRVIRKKEQAEWKREEGL